MPPLETIFSNLPEDADLQQLMHAIESANRDELKSQFQEWIDSALDAQILNLVCNVFNAHDPLRNHTVRRPAPPPTDDYAAVASDPLDLTQSVLVIAKTHPPDNDDFERVRKIADAWSTRRAAIVTRTDLTPNQSASFNSQASHLSKHHAVTVPLIQPRTILAAMTRSGVGLVTETVTVHRLDLVA